MKACGHRTGLPGMEHKEAEQLPHRRAGSIHTFWMPLYTDTEIMLGALYRFYDPVGRHSCYPEILSCCFYTLMMITVCVQIAATDMIKDAVRREGNSVRRLASAA